MKRWLIIGSCLLGVGLILFLVGMTLLDWDFSKLDTETELRHTYEVSELFYDISIETSEADVEMKLSGDGTCKVVLLESEQYYHTVSVENEKLTILAINDRAWFDYLNIAEDDKKIILYLPEGSYGSLQITGDTGDVEIPGDFTFETLDVKISTGDIECSASVSGSLKLIASTGDITLTDAVCGDIYGKLSTGEMEFINVQCRNLKAEGTTGDTILRNTTAEGTLSAERSTGDIWLDNCDGGELILKTTTGDVSGHLRTAKVFVTETRIGDVDVPDSTTGGKCNITTSTGDITLTIG